MRKDVDSLYISHLKLKNWRNFLDVNIDLTERTFLVGPNASGKSNFLDVFRFLRDIAKLHGGGIQKAIQDRGGISKIRCLSCRKSPDIVIEVHLSEKGNDDPLWKYSIGIKQEPRGTHQPFVAYEKVWKNNILLMERPDENDKKDIMRKTQTHLEQINMNEKFRDVAKFMDLMLRPRNRQV